MSVHKRRFPRVPSENTVLVASVDQETVDRFTKTHTVGLGGCGFVSENELSEGAILELMISVRPRAIRTNARVAYCFPKDGGDYDIGVEFLDLTDEDRAVLEQLFEADEGTE